MRIGVQKHGFVLHGMFTYMRGGRSSSSNNLAAHMRRREIRPRRGDHGLDRKIAAANRFYLRLGD
jgi:hypothetical protein